MKKKDINWIAKAPQRICSTCACMVRTGGYNEKFKCDKNGWLTKGNAVCDGYKAKS